MPKQFDLNNKSVLKALTSVYNTIHLFNFKEKTCEEISAFREVHSLFEKNYSEMDSQNLIQTVIKATTSEEYLNQLLQFTDFSTLSDRLAGKRSISMDFKGSIHGWTRSSFIPVSFDDDGNLVEVLYTTSIIQADRLREEKLMALVDMDGLTETFNRRCFEQDVHQYVKDGMPDNLVLISFDINGLKQVNDSLGHSAGDELIIGAANCIKKVFSPKGKVYRIGGDEFCAIINCSYKELQQLFGTFDSETSSWKGNIIKELTISKGAARYADYSDLSFAELQAKADRRMYQDKENFYVLKMGDSENFLKSPEMSKQVTQKANVGLLCLEINENQKNRIIIDSYGRKVLGLSGDETPEETYEQWFSRIHPDDKDSISAAAEKIICGNQTEVQYAWYHPTAGLIYIRNFGYRDASYTRGIRILGYLQNITNLLHLQKDELTGLYSRDFFIQKADEILQKHPGERFRFFVSDVENFKSINEKYGVETSDKLLKYLAESLKRKAPNVIIAGRITADKFVCLQKSGISQTSEEGRQLQNEILENSPIKNISWKHGVYYSDFEENVSAQQMCDRARTAVESIKGNYNVACAIYDKALANKIKVQQQILDNMEGALERQEIKIFLQPKHDLHKNCTGGAEALVRWIHPEIGFMNPGDFIPLFEKNGFIKKLDDFVIVEICKVLRRWLDTGKPIVPISVNLSRRDFDKDDLAEHIISIVDSYKLSHGLLHFELTESAFADNPAQITRIIKTLHDSGFAIELDDFGSGYSSLTSLSEIEFDILKLDMSIVRKEETDSSRSILDLCSNLIKQMDLISVAEGVETEPQLERLKKIGCDYIQGYYYSKPLSIDDFEKYLNDEKN